jgi:hypothetical protein
MGGGEASPASRGRGPSRACSVYGAGRGEGRECPSERATSGERLETSCRTTPIARRGANRDRHRTETWAGLGCITPAVARTLTAGPICDIAPRRSESRSQPRGRSRHCATPSPPPAMDPLDGFYQALDTEQLLKRPGPETTFSATRWIGRTRLQPSVFDCASNREVVDGAQVFAVDAQQFMNR